MGKHLIHHEAGSDQTLQGARWWWTIASHVWVVLVLVVLAGVVWHARDILIPPPWPEPVDVLDEEGELLPPIQVDAMLRRMRLITVQINSSVLSSAGHENWRGTAEAHVRCPVKYHYGFDLARMEPSDVRWNNRSVTVLVPAPTCLAVEVQVSQELDQRVHVSGLRLRTRAGEYYLGLARQNLENAARSVLQDPQMRHEIHEISRQQLEGQIRQLLGDGYSVRVEYK